MYPPAPPTVRTPGAVVTLRVLAWIEVVFLLVGVALAGAVAVASGSALSSDDELTQGFAGLGLLLGLVLAVFWLVLVVLVAVPTALLRTGRRSRKLGSLIVLTVVESLFAVVALLVTVDALTTSRPADAVFPLVVALLPIAIVVLAMLPASRAWAATSPVPAWGPPGPPPHGAPPPYGAPPPPYGASPPPSGW